MRIPSVQLDDRKAPIKIAERDDRSFLSRRRCSPGGEQTAAPGEGAVGDRQANPGVEGREAAEAVVGQKVGAAGGGRRQAEAALSGPDAEEAGGTSRAAAFSRGAQAPGTERPEAARSVVAAGGDQSGGSGIEGADLPGDEATDAAGIHRADRGADEAGAGVLCEGVRAVGFREPARVAPVYSPWPLESTPDAAYARLEMQKSFEPETVHGPCSGPRGAYAGAYLALLKERGYRPPATIPDALLIDDLNAWMARSACAVTDLDESILARFMEYHMKSRRTRREAKTAALRRLLTMLRSENVVAPLAVRTPACSPGQQLANDFGRHLSDERGYVKATVDGYTTAIRPLLLPWFSSGDADLADIDASTCG